MSLENYKEYPYLIYEPYSKTLKEEDPQRKDHQRICLEMMLSLNASICLANYYHIKTRGEDKDKEQLAAAVKKIFNRKSDEDSELKFDLGQMSIGKWNQVTRDTSKVLMEATNNGMNNDFLVEQIGELYQNNNWNKNVNELIRRRNADAHSGVKDNLEEELKKRQDMLDVLMEQLAFFNNYKLLIPIAEEVKDGNLICRCKDLTGDGNGTFDVNIDTENEEMGTELEHFDTYLFNADKKLSLSLEPMIISYNPSSETKELSTFIYNKTINRKKGNLHFANHREALDLIRENVTSMGSLPTPQELCQQFKSFRMQVEDEELINRKMPNIEVHRKFKTAASIINDDVFLDISIKNIGDADAMNVKAILEYPRDGFIRYDDDGKELSPTKQEKDLPEFTIPELPINEPRPEKKTYKFKAINGAQYHFDEMTLTYDYEDPDTDERHESDLDNEKNVVHVPPIVHQVVDPDDPQSQVPIINLHVSYRDHQNPALSGNKPYLGEEIDFIVNVENIGNSIAHDVDIHIFPPPEEMDLISGSTSWRGNINPGEVVTRLFTLRPRKQGIFSMKMRDILYTNEQGQLFKTLAYEDHKILVKNNPKFKYQFLLEDVWTDLTIDQDEEFRLKRNQKFTEIAEDDKQNIQIDVMVRAIRNVIDEILANTSLPIKQIAKDRMIGYCLEGYPFLIIDFREPGKEGENIKILLKGDFDGDKGLKSLGIVTTKGSKSGLSEEKKLRNWRGKYIDQTFYSISLSDINTFVQTKKLGGAALLKRLANQALRYVDNHEVLMIRFLKDLGEMLKCDNLFSKITFDKRIVKGTVSNDHMDNLMIQDVTLFMNTKNSLNLIAGHASRGYKFLGPELGKPQYGFKKGYKDTYAWNDDRGLYVSSPNRTTDIHLYSEFINDSTVEDMGSLIRRLVIDLANARAVLSTKKPNINKNEHIKIFFPDLCTLITETIGPFHYRFEREKDKGGIVYYRGEDMPLYKASNAFLMVQEEKHYNEYRIRIKLRFLSKDTFLSLKKLKGEIEFKVNYSDYWFYTFLYDTSSDIEEGKENILETLSHNAIKEAYNSAESPQQIVTYGWLKKCITPDEKGNAPYPILGNIIKSVYEEKGWVPYSDIADSIGRSLGKINRVVDILNLKPFLKCEPQHYENGKKGRIQMTPGSGALIKSVLDDLGA